MGHNLLEADAKLGRNAASELGSSLTLASATGIFRQNALFSRPTCSRVYVCFLALRARRRILHDLGDFPPPETICCVLGFTTGDASYWTLSPSRSARALLHPANARGIMAALRRAAALALQATVRGCRSLTTYTGENVAYVQAMQSPLALYLTPKHPNYALNNGELGFGVRAGNASFDKSGCERLSLHHR